MKKIFKIYLLGFLFVNGFAQKVSAVQAVKVENPLKADSIQQLIDIILDVVIAVGTPIAVLFLIYTGFLFVTARGDTGKLQKAREAFTWTLVGIAILLGASVLSAVIEGTIDQLGTGL